MIVGAIYKSKKENHRFTVLQVTEKTVYCLSEFSGNTRKVHYSKEGFLKSLGTGNYEMVNAGKIKSEGPIKRIPLKRNKK